MNKIYDYDDICEEYDEIYGEIVDVHGNVYNSIEIIKELDIIRYQDLIANYISEYFEEVDLETLNWDERDQLLFEDELHWRKRSVMDILFPDYDKTAGKPSIREQVR